MNKIHLTDLDLNLLIVLEILLQERNVTRAAERLGRTQSAVSHALNRLRRQLDDPLFVRLGGEMRPTPWAESITPDLERLLSALRRMISQRDRVGSGHHFVVAGPQMMSTLSAPLLSALVTQLPGCRLDWKLARRGMVPDLLSGDVDLLISPHNFPERPGLNRALLMEMQWVILGRADHPAFKRWSSSTWLEWSYLVLNQSHEADAPLRSIQQATGRALDVQATLPGYLEAAAVAASSDLLLLAPSAVQHLSPLALSSLPLFVPTPHIELYAYWGSSLEATASGRLLKDVLTHICNERLLGGLG